MTAKLVDDPELRALAQKATDEARAQTGGFTFWDLSDDGLVRMRRQYLRMIEDNPGRSHPKIDAWLASIRWARLVRWCLHMRYGAVDEHVGTKSWDRYQRFGEAPTYSFALELDKLRWSYRDHPKMPRRGTLRHIIDWDRYGDGKPHPLFALGESVSSPEATT